MAGGPIEFRSYFRKYTLEDARAGLQPLRLPIGPRVNGEQPTDAFVAVGLQWRHKEKVTVDGATVTQWSEWASVQPVREGDDAPA
jgi:hypothetical protein